MDWKRKLLKAFNLYAVTDLREPDSSILKKIEDAFRGGVDVIQLRSKALSDGELLKIGEGIRKLAKKYRKLFIVNDRVDLALACQADGVHLGQDDFPVALARKLLNDSSKIIGKSTHSLRQASEAQAEGADYLGFGPVFPTPTKPSYQAVGLIGFERLKKIIKIPVVAIGGIDETNLRNVLDAGAERIAVVRAIWNASSAFRAARNLKELLKLYAVPILQV
ncbi:MAG TPA: thiamine phosphate synthase [Candidatus Omnitrophota bacterium]|nr:thiamine phosphate synthase [Candidatus Omnitrophota bacterium]